MRTILEIKNLSVFYGANQAIKNISITVESGSIVSLIGANGSGKSTLMRTIIGITKAQEGTIQFKSTPILGMNSHEIVQLGVSQSPEGRQIFSNMTIYENLLLGAYTKRKTKKQLNEKIEEIFEIFPLLKLRKKQFAGTLSGGEQQMLAIGRALMIDPELLLLDEPSLGISPLLTEKLFETIVALNKKGTSILLAEQNALMALEISQKGYVLEVGKVIYENVSSHLLSNDIVRKAYLGV
jgi:branched-chain amino acid transport system ATP-binding protein